jgi:branched-chain amino acid transport system permease protein
MFEYFLSLVIITLIWTLLVQSYNLSFGLTGLFNLGHIVFYGVGAYTAAILNTKYGIDFLGTMGAAAVMAGGVAAVIGLLTLRLSGHYLAIATLGLAMISQVVALNWTSLTRGPLGIRGISEPVIFGYTFSSDLAIFGLYLGVVVLALWILYKLFKSPFGRLLRAIQDDEIAVKAVGKNVFVAKMWSLMLSAAFAGMAGAMYSHYRLFLDPTIVSLHEIILAVLILVVGGRGNFWGAIVSSIFIVMFVSEIPRFVGFPDSVIGAARNLLFALILIVTMMWRPKGLFTIFQKKTINKKR